MNDLIRLIRGWASARNLIKGSTAVNQYAKLMSEVGETANAIPTLAYAEVVDGVGDSFVVLTIICAITGISMEDCCANVLIESRANNALHGDERVAAQSSEFLWLIATLGKLGDAILKNDNELGRHLVTNAVRGLNRITQAQGHTLSECVQTAYDEIRHRKGVMYNGAFVKSTDARYDGIVRELALEA